MDFKYGKCQYGEGEQVYYYDIEKDQRENYDCPRTACSTRGLCEFHDKMYAESNADKVMELFNKWIKDEITAPSTNIRKTDNIKVTQEQKNVTPNL